MNDRLASTIHGAVGGATAAAAMTVARLLARRVGLIDTMMPQSVEQWLRQRTRVRGANPALYTAADQTLHLGYGALWGALYGACAAGTPHPAASAVLLGLAQWVSGPVLVLPTLNVTRPPRRSSARELGVNLFAHALYAAITAFATAEFNRQIRDPRRRIPHLRLVAKVG